MNIFVRLFFFYNFRRGLTERFLAMKLHQGPVFIDGMVSSTKVVVHSKTNFVKVVQNQLLFRKPLMLCANWYCKIAMWPIVRLRQPEALVGPAHIQYCMNIWLWKKFVCVGFHTIWRSLKKTNQSECQKCFDNWFKRMQKCMRS